MVALRQHVGQVRVLLLDGAHRLIDGLADVSTLRQAEQIRKPRLIRQIDDTRRMIIGRPDLPPRSGLRFEILFHRHEADTADTENLNDGNGNIKGCLIGKSL